jgi:hypothetical protein
MTILVETEMGVHLAGKSRHAVPIEGPLGRDDWLTEEDLSFVTLFIKVNRAALLEHWKGRTGTPEFLSKLRRA